MLPNGIAFFCRFKQKKIQVSEEIYLSWCSELLKRNNQCWCYAGDIQGKESPVFLDWLFSIYCLNFQHYCAPIYLSIYNYFALPNFIGFPPSSLSYFLSVYELFNYHLLMRVWAGKKERDLNWQFSPVQVLIRDEEVSRWMLFPSLKWALCFPL